MIFFFLYSLPNVKILDWTKLKAFADDKLNVAEMMISVSKSVENIVGKGENAGYQQFLLFPQCFQKASFSGPLKFVIVWSRVKLLSLSKVGLVKSKNIHIVKKIDATLMIRYVLLKVPIAAHCKGICLQNTSKSQSYPLKIWRLL